MPQEKSSLGKGRGSRLRVVTSLSRLSTNWLTTIANGKNSSANPHQLMPLPAAWRNSSAQLAVVSRLRLPSQDSSGAWFSAWRTRVMRLRRTANCCSSAGLPSSIR
ncbi:Uncharacterised protein [Serratia marcescens]|nr:Uncharacterised protein [Serratia marcescens]